MVKVKLLGHLPKSKKDREYKIDPNGPLQVKDLLSEVSYDENRIIVLVNGETKSIDSFLGEKDEVIIMPKIGGG